LVIPAAHALLLLAHQNRKLAMIWGQWLAPFLR
jgi:hypothetical protein